MAASLTIDDVVAASRRGAAFARLLRPGSIRMPVLVFVAAGLGEGMGTAHVVGGVLLIVGAYGVATILNDLADLDIDRANGRTDRPLVTGDLSLVDARFALGVSAVAVVVSQFWLQQPVGLAVTAVAVVLSAAYSGHRLHVQSRGMWAIALLAVTYFVLPLALAGAAVDPLLAAAILTAAMAMLLYKDAKDEVGDRALGKHTFLIRHGAVAVDRTAAALGVAGIAIGLAHAGPGWWTIAAAVALALQVRTVVTAPRPGRLVVHQRVAALVALVLLAATA